jgi:hypothetical protein
MVEVCLELPLRKNEYLQGVESDDLIKEEKEEADLPAG